MATEIMRTRNPALNTDAFVPTAPPSVGTAAETMTVQGTVNKTAFLLLLVAVSAGWVWKKFASYPLPTAAPEAAAAVAPWLYGGLFGGLVLALVTVFRKSWSPVTSPLYALAEGLFLGGLSSMIEARYPGIVIQAVALTFGTLFALLLAYKSRLIVVTDRFRMGVVAATGGIFLVYLFSLVAGLFGLQVPLIFGSGLVGVAFSLFVVVIAALNLVLDFDFIERGERNGAPKYMEWYGAFGLLVTLVWLYIEILRLLTKLRSR